MLCHDLVVISEGIDTSHIGGTSWSKIEGGIAKDTAGLRTVSNLGQRVAEVILKIGLF